MLENNTNSSPFGYLFDDSSYHKAKAKRMQGRRENSEAPRKKRNMSPLRAKRAENLYGLELYRGRLLLVYLMRPPQLEEFGVMRPLDLEALGPFAPLSVALNAYHKNDTSMYNSLNYI